MNYHICSSRLMGCAFASFWLAWACLVAQLRTVQSEAVPQAALRGGGEFRPFSKVPLAASIQNAGEGIGLVPVIDICE